VIFAGLFLDSCYHFRKIFRLEEPSNGEDSSRLKQGYPAYC
jgi:hypothetical protein